MIQMRNRKTAARIRDAQKADRRDLFCAFFLSRGNDIAEMIWKMLFSNCGYYKIDVSYFKQKGTGE